MNNLGFVLYISAVGLFLWMTGLMFIGYFIPDVPGWYAAG